MPGSRLTLFAFLVLLWGAPLALAADPTVKEYQIKAAMVYNLANSTEWPAKSFPSPGTPLTVCVLGKGHLAPAVQAIQGKTAKGRRIVVKQITRPDDAAGGHILVIDETGSGQVKRILDTLYLLDYNLLTVSDLPRFTQMGGMVGFFKQGGSVKIEINRKEAEQAHINFSAQLLALAKISD